MLSQMTEEMQRTCVSVARENSGSRAREQQVECPPSASVEQGPSTSMDGTQTEEDLHHAPQAVHGPEAARSSRVGSGPRAAATQRTGSEWDGEKRAYFGTRAPAEPPVRTVEEALKEFEKARALASMKSLTSCESLTDCPLCGT